MSDEYTVQCPKCGTHYNDLQEVCPYCGQPQPDLIQSTPLPPGLIIEQSPEPEPDLESVPLPAPEEGAESQFVSEAADQTLFGDDDIFAIVGETDHLPEHIPPYQFEDEISRDETSVQPWVADDSSTLDETPVLFPPGYEYHTDQPGYLPGRQGYPHSDLESDEYGHIGGASTPDAGPYPQATQRAPSGYSESAVTDGEPKKTPRRLTFRRVSLGCLGLLFCTVLFYAGLGVLAVRSGLQERAQVAYNESQEHFDRGQELLAENSIELAIAEFERALKLNPSFREARQALREAQKISQAQPTPTSQTRTAAAVGIFNQAKILLNRENWIEAIVMLSQVRDLDPDYQPEQVSELLFSANYNRGLQLIQPDQIEEALTAFEEALAERPDDPEATSEYEKASLYLRGTTDDDKQLAIQALRQLYRTDENYLDVSQRLRRLFEAYGDDLAKEGEWCLARAQFTAAIEMRTSTALRQKIETSSDRCQGSSAIEQTGLSTPEATRTLAISGASPQPTTIAQETTAEPVPASRNRGQIYFSAFSASEERWEVLSVPAEGGTATLLAADATMPAISPDGRILLFRSERPDSIGIHALDLEMNSDTRATQLMQHMLPRWGNENLPFLFVAEEPGTGRWQIFQGFADGKGAPIILEDGRTPDWSPDGQLIAFQGTDQEGNNPGIYLRPIGGGAPTRLTTHESDRAPAFSPDGKQIAYMSTQRGNWDIYVVSLEGGTPQPVTTFPGNDGLPAWSPDGTSLAYVSDAGGGWGIYTVGLDNDTPVRITDWDGTNRSDWLIAQIGWTR